MRYYGKRPSLYRPKIKGEIRLTTYCFRLPASLDPKRPQINTGETNKDKAGRVRDDILDQGVSKKNNDTYTEAYLDRSVEAYLEYKEPRLAKASFKSYRLTIRDYEQFVKDRCGSIPKMTEIETTIPEAFLNKQKTDGKSDKTYNNKKIILSNFYKWNLKHNYVAKNPVSDIPDLRVSDPDVKALPREYIALILRELKDEDNPLRQNKGYYEIMATIYYAGLRISEVTHLTADDLDWQNSLIHIHSKTVNGLAYQTKTKQAWYAPLSKELKPILTSYIKEHRDRKSPWLFPNTHGKPIKNDLIAHEIKKIMRRLNFPPEYIKRPLHSGRHAFTSHSIESGVPEWVVQKALGHRSNIMTKRYTHLSPEYVKEQFDKLTYRQKGSKKVK